MCGKRNKEELHRNRQKKRMVIESKINEGRWSSGMGKTARKGKRKKDYKGKKIYEN